MSLLLGDVKIPGYDQKISATLSIAGEDMSGNSSFTPQAETGYKPKQIAVGTHIKFENQADLRLIVDLAEAKNNVDEKEIYRIVNDTAKGMNIRQVCFQGDLTVRELDGKQAWSVSFKLIEYLSTAEKKERRIKPRAVTEQIPSGEVLYKTPSSVDQVKQMMIDQVAAELLPAVIPTSISGIKNMIAQIPGAQLINKIPISIELVQEMAIEQILDSDVLKKQSFAMSEIKGLLQEHVTQGALPSKLPTSIPEMKELVVNQISNSPMLSNKLISTNQIEQVLTEQIPDELFEPENMVAAVETGNEMALESFEGTMAWLDEKLK